MEDGSHLVSYPYVPARIALVDGLRAAVAHRRQGRERGRPSVQRQPARIGPLREEPPTAQRAEPLRHDVRYWEQEDPMGRHRCRPPQKDHRARRRGALKEDETMTVMIQGTSNASASRSPGGSFGAAALHLGAFRRDSSSRLMAYEGVIFMSTVNDDYGARVHASLRAGDGR